MLALRTCVHDLAGVHKEHGTVLTGCKYSVQQWVAAQSNTFRMMNKTHLLSEVIKVHAQIAFADSPIRSLKIVESVPSERTSALRAHFNSPHDPVTAFRATRDVLGNHNAFCLACLESLD